MDFQTVNNFWFKEIDPAYWWKKDGAFDEQLRKRFGAWHAAATRCELYSWRSHPEGRLAEIIVLDQFSRNLYRDSAQAFINDTLALALAQEAIFNRADQAVDERWRSFYYMPLMHSESKVIHEIAVRLFSRPGLESSLEYELKHKAIIDRFGRYPHRNQALGRTSTREELEFLTQPGSAF